MELLLSVANAGLIITFFSCGQSTFMQWYSVALNKRLISATVHAGMVLNLIAPTVERVFYCVVSTLYCKDLNLFRYQDTWESTVLNSLELSPGLPESIGYFNILHYGFYIVKFYQLN